MKTTRHSHLAILAAAAITFSLAVSAQAQTLKVLHAFTGKADGATPHGSLIFDSAGNLYGVTAGGGSSTCTGGCGTAYELSPTTSGPWKVTPVFQFTHEAGSPPVGNLLLNSSGDLIGVTNTGSFTQGLVYELSRSKGSWQQSLSYIFNGPSDGGLPSDGLVADSKGNLYGVDILYGDDSACSGYGCGAAFELTPTSSGFWLETTLHDFTGGADGAYPNAHLISDSAGNLYGTAPYGGNLTGACPIPGCGVVFQLSRNSSGIWTQTILYSFSGPDGASPFGSLAMDAAGNLYGTTFYGGKYCPSAGCGVVFKLAPNSDGTWQQTMLHDFRFTDGAQPESGLVLDSAGNLYGTTSQGGISTSCGGNGCGVLFKLAPTASGPWTFSRLHAFTGGLDGAQSSNVVVNTPLIFGSDGNLYGVAGTGGAHGDGIVFSIAP
jgi:uncharacterized repeat protein (TIGR03803 family)